MITFHGDRFVPPELCRLLYHAVPKEHHVPVRFHNRRHKDTRLGRWGYPLGSASCASKSGSAHHIDINLNPIFGASWHSNPKDGAPSTKIWRTLLEVCLHEAGHVATNNVAVRMNQHAYHAEYKRGRVYWAIERLADEWMKRRIERILYVDPRLGQPRVMSGYFGARLARWSERAAAWDGGKAYSCWIKERRCRKTGAQLTAGDVLSMLGMHQWSYPNAYQELRRASFGIGIDYEDGAGRCHKLYRWGDLAMLEGRLAPLSRAFREARAIHPVPPSGTARRGRTH